MNAQLVPAGDFPAAAALLKHAPWPITLRFRRREPSQAEKEAWLRDPTAAGDQVSEAPCHIGIASCAVSPVLSLSCVVLFGASSPRSSAEGRSGGGVGKAGRGGRPRAALGARALGSLSH